MKRRPNILLMCPDEMKATAMGCYGNGVDTTPFMDSIARKGALYRQCHTVHPKCVPSRASLITGQYPHVNGHRTLDLEVRPHEINMIRDLRRNGYQTALVGKNHVVDKETMPLTFDFHERGGKLGNYRFDPDGSECMPWETYYVGEARLPLEDFGDYRETELAMRWLAEERDKERPFFLWLNWNAPHPPYSIPKPYHGMFERGTVELPPKVDAGDKPPLMEVLRREHKCTEKDMNDDQWRELIGTYHDMCRFVDDECKRMFTCLERIGELDNTIVVFWSDHGDFAGEFQLPEKWDTAFYDCITRVPLIIHYPEKINPVEVKGLVESIDIFPTLLNLAGIEAPKGIQGHDTSPLLKEGEREFRDLVFCQGGQEQALIDNPLPIDAKERPAKAYYCKQASLLAKPEINIRAKMIRDHRYKYTYRLGGFEEFYDLREDPWETVNQARNPEFSELLVQYRRKMMEKLIKAETVEPYQEFLEA